MKVTKIEAPNLTNFGMSRVYYDTGFGVLRDQSELDALREHFIMEHHFDGKGISAVVAEAARAAKFRERARCADLARGWGGPCGVIADRIEAGDDDDQRAAEVAKEREAKIDKLSRSTSYLPGVVRRILEELDSETLEAALATVDLNDGGAK